MKFSKQTVLRVKKNRAFILPIAFLFFMPLLSRGQSISLTSIGVPYIQNFNTLATTGTTNTLSINGWYLNETGTGANGLYAADNGTLTTGDVYSYAPTALPAERALGTLRTTTFSAIFGAKFTNNTGYTVTSLFINYKGEEYRQGTSGVFDELDFSYSTNATDLVTGTYTPVSALNFVTTFNGGIGPTFDPNQTPFARAVSGNITGLSIAPGATVWIRWTDLDAAGASADDGLAVDDFSLTPGAACSLVETFEGIAANATTYTSNGIGFTLSTTPASANFRCSNDLPSYGFTYSDKYLDNFNTLPNPCTMTAASPFRLKYMYVYPSDVPDGANPQTSGVNITFTGKRSGVTKFTYSPAAALFAGANASDPYSRGFSLVDFSVSGDDNIAIDQLVVTLGGTTIYFAIDNFSFCAGACSSITVTNPGTTTGTLGTAFSQTFTQSLGATPVTFTTASTLPTGLSLSSAGVLSGTPTQTGTFPITVTVTDVNGCVQAGSSYNLVIACPTITVTKPVVTTGTVGTAFSQNFTQAGGALPVSFTTASTLPTGLSLSTAGVLSGTPTQSGSFPIVVTVTDNNGCTGTSTTYTLVISCQAITVTNPAVTTGSNGAPFSQTFTQSGALAGATFTINTGTLPTGLTLSTAGVLSGTPTQTGPFPITVKVTDGHACTGIGATYNLVINAPVVVMSSSLRDALLVDVNGNTIANPGDQLRYTTTIRNTGGLDATGVNLNLAAPSNTTENPNSRSTSALARDDAFSTSFQTLLNVGNLLTNDFGLNAGVPTISVVSFGTTASLGTTTPAGSAGTTNAGGVLTVNANGTFSYQPPVGFSGNDQFMYIATTGVAGLPNNDAVVTITVGPDITFGTTKVDVLCKGASTGSITFTGVSGGSGSGYTFSVNGAGGPFQAGNPYTGLAAGTYTPAVKDGSGYIKVSGSTVTITEPPTAVSFTHVDVPNNCNGTSLGSITITASGGIPGYTYSKNGAGGPFVAGNAFTLLAGGTYSISVKDANGCIVTQSVPLTDPPAINFTTTPINITCNGGNDGSITFSASGGTGALQYSITGSGGSYQASNAYTGLIAGTYNPAVKDANGCIVTAAAITLTQPAAIVVSGTIPNLTYNVAMATATFTKTGGVGSPANPWSISAGSLPTGVSLNTANGNVTGTPLQTGSFNVTIKYTDASGCIGTKAVSFTVAPNLANNTFNVVGNTQLVSNGHSAPATPFTADATNILTNDQADVTITITAGTFATVNSGSITIDAAGKFTYTPPVGSTAADSYVYTGTANGVSATATINFTIANMVWYVNKDYAGGNGASDGRSHRPFTTVNAAEAASAVNQIIYVHTGTGNTTGDALLKSGQTLRGAGSTLTVGALTIASGTKPTLTGMITLANNVSVDGFDMNTGTTTAITSSGATSVAVAVGNITTSGALNAITLTNTTGSISNTGGTLTGAATGAVFNVSGGTATITNAANIVQTLANRAINIASATGGIITFSGTVSSTGTSTGINLTSNAGATINFTNTITLNTGANAAFTATGGGIVNVTGSTNNVTTTSGTAINWSAVTGTSTENFNNINSTSGAAIVVASSGATNFIFNDVVSTTGTAVNINTATGAFSFHKISSNGASKGIIVNALTGSGSFTVTGTGGSGLCDASHIGVGDCGGGSILNSTARGAEFVNANNISLKNMYFKGNGSTAIACVDDVSAGSDVSCNAAIHLTSSNTVTLDHIYVDGTGSNDMGILGNAVSALTATNVEVANFTNIAKVPIVLQNLSGTCPFTSLNVHNNNTIHSVFITQNTGTSNISFTSPTLTNNNGTNNPDQIQVDGYNTANITVAATNVNISSGSINTGNGVMFQANSGSTMNATLNGGTVIGTNGVLMASSGDGTHFTYNVTNLSNVANHNLGSNGITVGKASGAAGSVTTGSVTNNTITSATCGGGCFGIKFSSFGAGGSASATITGNNISGVDATAIAATAGQGATATTTIIQNNNIHNPALTQPGSIPNSSYAIDLIAGTQAGDAPCFFANLGDMSVGHTVPANRNLISGSWASGGNPIEAVEFNNSVFRILNLSGGAGPWIAASNAGSGTDATQIGTVPFQAGTACPLTLGKGGVRSSKKFSHTSENISYSLSEKQLQSVVSEALVIWQTQGLNDEQIKKLRQIQFSIGKLEAGQLANKSELGIVTSYDANGKGWFIGVDKNSYAQFDPEIFSGRMYTSATKIAAGRVDLLTCILHEMGHILGYKDLHGKKYRNNIMYEKLSVGERRLPTKEDVQRIGQN